jgi:mono/diheme cytochrome c family protein
VRKRVLAAALLAGVCSLGVVACGSSDDNGDSSTAAPAATSAAASATTEAPAATSEAATTEAATTEAATTAATGGGDDAAAGKPVFVANCAGCHTLADAAASGAVGPNLDDLKPDEDTVKTQVENGGGAMPAFKGTLSDDEIASVAKYVSSVAGQ